MKRFWVLPILLWFGFGENSFTSADAINDQSASVMNDNGLAVQKTLDDVKSGILDDELDQPLPKLPSIQQGRALLKRISNKTNYPMSIKLLTPSQSQSELSLLPDGCIVRIKSISTVYGDKKPYLTVLAEKDDVTGVINYPLRANCYKPDDQRCHFMVTNLIDPRTGEKWLSFTPVAFAGKFITCGSLANDKYIVTAQSANLNSTTANGCYWALEGNLNKCYLKNAKTFGYLGPSLLKDVANNISKTTLGASNKGSDATNCRYGDLVAITSKYSEKSLGLDNGSFFLGAQENSAYFILKGAHANEDRYNCIFGAPVKSGDVVRLEELQSGKNLNLIGDQKIDFTSTVPWSVDNSPIPDLNKFIHLPLAFNGQDGIGEISDNWVIALVENAAAVLKLGAAFVLQNPTTGAYLCAEMALAKSAKKLELVGGVKSTDEATKQAQNQALSKLKDTKNKPIKAEDDPYQVAKTWYCSANKRFTLNEKDLMRTGFSGGAPFERININNPEEQNQSFAIEIIQTGNADLLLAKSDKWTSIPLDKIPTQISGLLEESIENFTTGMAIKIRPMLGYGILWFERSLDITNQFSLTFWAQVEDESELAVVLGTNLTDDYKYKVVLGEAGNTSAGILRHVHLANALPEDRMLTRVFATQYKKVKLQTGTWLPFWMIFNAGLFLVGASENLGENAILAFQELGFEEQITRVGFSCNTKPVTIGNIKFGPVLEALSPERIYGKFTSADISDAKQLTTKGFRIPNELYLCLHSNKLDSVEVLLGDSSLAQKDKYFVNLDFRQSLITISHGDDDNKVPLFEAHNTMLAKHLNQNGYCWLNYNHGLFWAGLGENPGEAPLFVFKADQPLPNITGFSCTQKSRIDDFSANSGSSFGLKIDSVRAAAETSAIIGNRLVGLTPYQYTLNQEGEWVMMKDFVSKKNYQVARVAQKGADYSLMLAIQANGIPKMRWAWQPENEELMNEKMKGRILQAIGEGFISSGMALQGVGVVGDLLATTENIAVIGAALAPMLVASRITSAASFDYKKAADQFATHNEQNVTKEASLGLRYADLSIKNRDRVERSIENIKDVSPSTRENFFRILAECNRVVALTTDPHVLGTAQLKDSFFSIVSSLYEYHAELFAAGGIIADGAKGNIDNSYQEFIKFFLSATQNNNIFNAQDQKDVAKKNQWQGWANLLLRELLAKNKAVEIEVPPLFGEYLWLSDKLSAKGSGKISFTAKGSGEISIAFAAKPMSYLGSRKNLYEAVFINTESSSTCILRISSLGTPAAATTDESLALSEVDAKNFWFSIDQGYLEAGIVQEDGTETKLLNYRDPYPTCDEMYIGIGNWNASATISNIAISAVNTAPIPSEAVNQR